jgi:hypothetical protein
MRLLLNDQALNPYFRALPSHGVTNNLITMIIGGEVVTPFLTMSHNLFTLHARVLKIF